MTVEFTKVQMSAMSVNSKSEFYRVYKTQAEYVDVEALTANEAMEKSQIKNPHKIKFMRPKSSSFLSSADLQLKKPEEQQEVNQNSKEFVAENPPKIDQPQKEEPKVSE